LRGRFTFEVEVNLKRSRSKVIEKKQDRIATMANGWAPDGAVQDQIDDTIKDAVTSARARMPTGEGETHCVECGEEIPEARRQAVAGARTCVACQSALDCRPVNSGFNRRGNKDSQLR
jgi:phage/conjugal plasmid C-4 type zinc finger TraR family protein